MKKIHEVEDELFNDWRKKSIEIGDGDNLAPDGLLYHDGPYYNDGYWSMEVGDEEETWHNASKRLLIVTKDLNNKDEDGSIADGWDIRVETGLKNGSDNQNYWSAIQFYKRLRMWAYGLLKMDNQGNYPTFNEAYDMDKSGPFYNRAPIARINVKKKCGTNSISDYELSNNINLYKDLLIRNFQIYDEADIILCCDPHYYIVNFIIENLITDLKCVCASEYYNNLKLFYSPSSNKVVINGYHPSSRISYEDMYNELMSVYQVFLKS